jgi:hypothetical protein
MMRLSGQTQQPKQRISIIAKTAKKKTTNNCVAGFAEENTELALMIHTITLAHTSVCGTRRAHALRVEERLIKCRAHLMR